MQHRLTSLGFGFDDYKQMFQLSNDDLNKKILDCYPGVSAFAAEMFEKHHTVIALDPLYEDGLDNIKAYVETDQKVLFEQNSDLKVFASVRQNNRETFYEDYAKGLKEKRYVAGHLPLLNFDDETFDLALVNHVLFTYTDEFSLDFHIKAIQELMRVANEVRIFPLVDKGGHLSPYVGQIIAESQMMGLNTELKSLPFEIQPGGNAMLKLWNEKCSVKKHA